MTPGVAPRCEHSVHAMDTEPTTLSEFGGESDDADSAERDDAPTPASNADDIQHLVELVGGLTDQVGDLAAELEQHETADGIDDEQPDPKRMFH